MINASRTARSIARAELTRAILDHAGRQLAVTGPAALSVRAVARELGMASSAVYRYFPSRDSLLTALIVQAHGELADRLEQSQQEHRPNQLRRRWRSACLALRNWALERPHHYSLVYGTPVPDYAAPTDTVEPARRVARTILAIVADAHAAGIEPAAGPTRVSTAERAAVAPISNLVEPALPAVHTVRALSAWAALFGQLSLELFGHFDHAILDLDTHYATLVDQLAADLGLKP